MGVRWHGLLVAALIGGCSRTDLIWDDDDESRSGGDLEASTWTGTLPCGEPVGLDVDTEGGVAVASRCSSTDGTGTLLITRLDAQGETRWEASFPSGHLCDTDDDCRIAFTAPVVISGPGVFVACQLEGGVATLLVVDEHGESEPPRRIAAIRPRASLALASDQEDGIFVATETDEVMFGETLRRATAGPIELARLTQSGVVAWVTGIGDPQREDRIFLAERPDGGIVMAGTRMEWSGLTTGGSLEWAIGFPGVPVEAAYITGLAVDGAGDVHLAGRYAADEAQTPLWLEVNQTLAGRGRGDIFVVTEHAGTFPLALAIGDAAANEASDLDATTAGDAWIVGMGWPNHGRGAAGNRPFVTFVDAPRGDLHARLLPEGIVPRFVRALPAGGAVVAASITGPLRLAEGDVVSGGVLIASFPGF